MLKISQNWGKIANYLPPPMINKDRNSCMFVKLFDFECSVSWSKRFFPDFVAS